jgi:hypothetical protein
MCSNPFSIILVKATLNQSRVIQRARDCGASG